MARLVAVFRGDYDRYTSARIERVGDSAINRKAGELRPHGWYVMAIQFQCPSCRQPIEIDEQWAAQPVACPYCKRVVTAPAQSTWPAEQVPTASPTTSEVNTLGPAAPPVSRVLPVPPARSTTGAWALTLACTAAVLCILAYFSFSMSIVTAVMDTVGPNATPQQQQEAMTKVMTEGKIPRSPLASASSLLGTACGIGSLVLALLTFVRREGGRGMAIAAVIITPLFLFCQIGLVLFMAMPSMKP